MKTVEMAGGFLELTEEDKLIDKFIDEEGNISEDELEKLSDKLDGQENKPESEDADTGQEDEEPRADALGDDEHVEGDQPEKDAEPAEVSKQDDKRARAESNQAKAIRIEREKRKDLEKQLKLQAERTNKMEQVLSQVLQPKDEPKENIPDAEEDPIAYQNYKIDRLEKLQKQHQDNLRQQQEQVHNQRQVSEFMDNYTRDARTFSESEPDFLDAYNYLVSSRLQEHLAAGYNDKEADYLLRQEEAGIAARAYQDGINPAERIFSLAKTRGYTKKADPVKAPSKLAVVKQGLKANKSLGPGQGTGQKDSDNLDISDIDSMTDEQVDNLWKLAKSGRVNFT